ncbi:MULTISPECIES: hypothetical protein [unclassified Acidiphilium]|nr:MULTISPECIES: hypothetical protein [unclassified Acidiphilium]
MDAQALRAVLCNDPEPFKQAMRQWSTGGDMWQRRCRHNLSEQGQASD